MSLTEEEIGKMRAARNALRTSYGARNDLFQRFEEIYFMTNVEKPKDSNVDKDDWKVTASPSGRNKVTGVKQILDTSEIHVKVKQKGKVVKSDQIEEAYKAMLRVSGEYRSARVEADNNLSSTLYGPVVQIAESVEDLITSKTKDYKGEARTNVNKFVLNQLRQVQKRTPFLIGTMNPKESFPMWGEYGMVGHLHEYTVKGNVVNERWCLTSADESKDYKIQDFFHYEKRLVEAEGISEPLFADTWVDVDKEAVTSIPVFVRFAGGSTLFHEPERQLQSLLYAYATGEWDKRENLFWTYLFTAIYIQGMPGPVLLKDPDDTSGKINVSYEGGVKVIEAKGKLEQIQVIDGDVLRLRELIDNETAQSTVQPQTLGAGPGGETYSGYVSSTHGGKIVLNDPKEAIEKVHRDTALHIMARIKAESTVNPLIEPANIPDDIDIDVTYEPNLTQDDLRNSQIVTALLGSGADVSKEWINTNLLKISDSKEMWKQKSKEQLRDAMLAQIVGNPQIMQGFITTILGMKPQAQQPTEQTSPDQATNPEGVAQEAGMEQLPQTDAMIPQDQRS